MDYAAIIAAIATVAGPIVGQVLAQADRDTVLNILKQSRDEFGRIQVPKLKELTAQLAPDTEFNKIKEDPRYREQQHAADQQLDNVISSGGLTLDDRAALNAIRNRVSRSEAAGRHAIENQMAARGTLDSGAQLAMQLANQQNAADDAASAGENTAAAAQKRAYEAILARSQMAGEGLDRDWRQQAARASAQDAINKGNADIRNLTNRYNQQLPMQEFNAGTERARALAGANSDLANFYSGKAAGTQNLWAQGGKAVGQGIAAGFSEDDPEYVKWKKSQGKG